MKYQRKKEKVIYTKEQIIEAAKTCETKGDFTKKFPIMYRQLMHREYSYEVMATLPRKIKWSNEELINEAKKHKTKVDWMRTNISSYNTALKSKDVFMKCVEHMETDFVFGEVKYTYEHCKEIYDKAETLKEIIEKHKGVYNAAIRKGWHKELSKNKKKYANHKSRKWTYEKVKNEALKYNSIKDFAKNSRPAYFKAVYSKWLMEIVGHMEGGYTKWTLEKIVDILSKYEAKEWYKIKECKAPLAFIKRHNLQDQLNEKLSEPKSKI